jgi:ParB-like chromosome segregation protein Spo0J
VEKSAVARPPGTEEALRRSIEQVGVLFPIVMTEAGIVVDGELRLKVANELGVECPVRAIYRNVRDLKLTATVEEIRLRLEAEKDWRVDSAITRLASEVDENGVGLWPELVIAAALGVSVEHVVAHMRKFLVPNPDREDVRELFPRERRTVDGGVGKAAVTTADMPPPKTERPPLHEVMNYIPELPRDDLELLRKDIKANGQREPVLVDAKGRLVDGRARWEILAKLGIVPEQKVVAGSDSQMWAASLEANRFRFPTIWERTVLAASLPARTSPNDNRVLTALQAAEVLRVQHHSVGSLRRIIALGVPELVDAITSDRIRLGSVQKIVRNYPREQWLERMEDEIATNARVRPQVRPVVDTRPRSSKGSIGAAHILKIVEQLDALGLVLDTATGLDPGINSADAAQWLTALAPRRNNLTRLTQMLKQRKEST